MTNTSNKKFCFSIETHVDLTVDEIWPDNDAPENPTVDDVLKVIAECGGATQVIQDWNLVDDLTLSVSEDASPIYKVVP
jgi:hypothetical protein